MSVAAELSRLALDVNFCDLPTGVVHQTKRVLLDTLGCAIGGAASKASQIIQEQIRELGGAAESTIIGSGLSTSAVNATLANGVMVRFLDFNDTAFILRGNVYRTGYHPSESIPAILAVGEKRHSSGQDIIAAIVAGYDLSFRFLDAVTGPGMEKLGWNGDTRAAYIMPIVTGRLIGLNQSQMENAVGICSSCHSVLGILDTPAEEYTMTKNMRFPTMSYWSVLAASLAQKGFTGPVGVIEGHDGFVEAIMRGNFDTERLVAPGSKFAIMDVCLKSIIADYSSHGHLSATLSLVRQHDIHPEDVATVNITTSKRCAEHTGDPVKKYPKNKETADHSSYYLTAVAITDRQIGSAQFSPEKLSDKRILDLIGKINLKGDPALDRFRPAGISEIILKSGEKYSLRVDNPRGHASNPMTDGEVVAKFNSIARQYMSESHISQLIDTVFALDKLSDTRKLTRLLVFDNG